MHKLIIVEPGWKDYTGFFGDVEFKDGVSVEPVPSSVSSRLAGLIRFRTEEGGSPSPAGLMAERRHAAAPVARRMRTMQEHMDEEAQQTPAEPEKDDSEDERLAAEQAQAQAQAEADAKAAKEKAEKEEQARVNLVKLKAVLTAHDETVLTSLAKEKGIAGLRAIATEINEYLPEEAHIKSNSIPGLIQKIIAMRANVVTEEA